MFDKLYEWLYCSNINTHTPTDPYDICDDVMWIDDDDNDDYYDDDYNTYYEEYEQSYYY